MRVIKLLEFQAIARRFLFHCKVTPETLVQGGTLQRGFSFLSIVPGFCRQGHRLLQSESAY